MLAVFFSLYFANKQRGLLTTSALAATVLFMVLMRDLVRQAYLAT